MSEPLRETDEEPEELFVSETEDLMPVAVRRKKYGDTGVVVETFSHSDEDAGQTVPLMTHELPAVIGALVRAYLEDIA